MTLRVLPLVGTSLLIALTGYLAAQARSVVQTEASIPSTAPIASERVVSAPPTGTSRQRTTARAARPDIYYRALTERPLFAPTRRPASAEPAPEPVAAPAPLPTPAPSEPPAPPKVSMHGVIGSDGDTKALLSLNAADPEWTPVGATLDGWTLTEIGPDWAILTRDDQTFKVDMY